jgi:hypothetical protein
MNKYTTEKDGILLDGVSSLGMAVNDSVGINFIMWHGIGNRDLYDSKKCYSYSMPYIFFCSFGWSFSNSILLMALNAVAKQRVI